MKDRVSITPEEEEEAKKAMLAYRREWYKKNKDRQRVYTMRYFLKKMKEMQEKEGV